MTEDNEWLPSEFPRGKTLYTYQDAKNFSEGMAAVQVDGLWGYIHLDGTRAIQPAFQHAGSFLNGRAVVQSNEGEWHFIDPTGRKIESIMLPEGYMPTGLHSNGFLVVENEHGKNIVDQEGKLFFESEKISITRKKTPDNVPLWLVMESGFSYVVPLTFLRPVERSLQDLQRRFTSIPSLLTEHIFMPWIRENCCLPRRSRTFRRGWQ